LEIYALLAPVLVFCLALAVVWVTRYLDQREERRRHPAE
jgi:hypothetical protein